jgi:hypothetical protein
MKPTVGPFVATVGLTLCLVQPSEAGLITIYNASDATSTTTGPFTNSDAELITFQTAAAMLGTIKHPWLWGSDGWQLLRKLRQWQRGLVVYGFLHYLSHA